MTLALLPHLSDFVLEALPSPCFRSSAVDQFLTQLAMTADAEYSGESDFGTVTILTLDDEDRTALALVWALHYEEDPSADQWKDAGAVLLWGSDQKWWGDASFYATEELALEDYHTFDLAYSNWLGCEDCGAETGDACTCNDEVTATNPYGGPGGLLEEFQQAENLIRSSDGE